jgi:hypothetical protein
MSTSPLARLLLEAAQAETKAAACYNEAGELLLRNLGGRAPTPEDGDEVMAVFRLKNLAQGALDRARQCVATAEHIQAGAAVEGTLPGVGDLS